MRLDAMTRKTHRLLGWHYSRAGLTKIIRQCEKSLKSKGWKINDSKNGDGGQKITYIRPTIKKRKKPRVEFITTYMPGAKIPLYGKVA